MSSFSGGVILAGGSAGFGTAGAGAGLGTAGAGADLGTAGGGAGLATAGGLLHSWWGCTCCGCHTSGGPWLPSKTGLLDSGGAETGMAEHMLLNGGAETGGTETGGPGPGTTEHTLGNGGPEAGGAETGGTEPGGKGRVLANGGREPGGPATGGPCAIPLGSPRCVLTLSWMERAIAVMAGMVPDAVAARALGDRNEAGERDDGAA